jgi:hypothetical protein
VEFFAEAVKTKLGIVGLLFVVVAGLCRAFFPPAETPLRVRLIVFGVLFGGFSLFAVAILAVETPSAPDETFGVSIPKSKANEIRTGMKALDALALQITLRDCDKLSNAVNDFSSQYLSTVSTLQDYIDNKLRRVDDCRNSRAAAEENYRRRVGPGMIVPP